MIFSPLTTLVILAVNFFFIPGSWTTLEPANTCTARHENSLVAIDSKLLLVGGRGIKPVESYDPLSNSWTTLAESPFEFSHFQGIVYEDELWVIGAFTGPYPHEIPVPNIYIFNPRNNKWRMGPAIPEDRRRGAAGAVVYQDKIYLVGGEVDGHWDGTQAWFDQYDPGSNSWRTMPDAPRVRDHISIAVVNDKLLVAGGRVSSAKTNNVLGTTLGAVDVFDFKTGKWSTIEDQSIPTPRAGASAVALDKHVLIIGGESGSQEASHSEVEAFNMETMTWETFPSLNVGRHGTGAVEVNGDIYTVAGSGNRGGGPELNSIEKLSSQ
jgi:N-acetylneuraminic acid mutarotase